MGVETKSNINNSPPAREIDRTSLLSYPRSNNSVMSNNTSTDDVPIWKNQRLSKHQYTISAALCLSLVGIVFMIVGLVALYNHRAAFGVVMFIFAVVTGLPGVYQSVYIYRALKGRPGYHMSNIPSFD